MPHTIKTPNGQADVSSVSPTGVISRHLFGPPVRGARFTQGIYIQETSGANGTYRHLYDKDTPGVASPSSWSYAGF